MLIARTPLQPSPTSLPAALFMNGKTEVKAQATEAPPTEVPSPDVREHTKDGLFVHGSGMVVNGSQHLSNNCGPQFQNVSGNVSLNFNGNSCVVIQEGGGVGANAGAASGNGNFFGASCPPPRPAGADGPSRPQVGDRSIKEGLVRGILADLFKVLICNLEDKDNKIQEYFNNNPSHTSRNMKDAFVLGCFLGEKPRALDDVRGFVPSPPSEVDDEGRGAHPWKRYFDNFHAAPISGFSSMYGFSFTSGGLM